MIVWRNEIVAPIALAAVCAVATSICVRLAAITGGPIPLWITDGIILGMLLTAVPGAMRRLLVYGAAGATAGWAAAGGGTTDGILAAGCSLLLIATAMAVLRHIGWKAGDVSTTQGFTRAAVAIFGLAPLLPALLTGAVNVLPGLGTTGPSDALRWVLTESLGLAVVVPIVFALRRHDLMLLLVPPLLTSTLVLLTLHVAVCALAFLRGEIPLGFVVCPTLLLLAGRLGTPGAGVGVLITATIAIGGAFAGYSPARILTSIAPADRLIFLQFFLIVLSIVGYPTGSAVIERRRMSQSLIDQHAKLGRSENLYRLLAENTSDIITRVRFDGRRVYVSPSITDVLGWSIAEATRPDWQSNVHPDDLAGFIEVREKLRAGASELTNTYRFRRKDGSWAWLEARMQLVRGADGTPKEFVANSRDITRQKEAEHALEAALAERAEQAMTDGLTGVANRRKFDTAFALEWRRALRAGEPLGLLMIDADHFKGYNDRYGHQAGDDCLRAIATTIAANIRRPHDLAARYGGEEFVVILPATDLDGARQVARQIRAAIEAMDMPHEGSADGVVTVSIGTAGLVPDRHSRGKALVEAADEALYVAKRNGRNRVEVANPQTGSAVVVPLLPHMRRSAH